MRLIDADELIKIVRDVLILSDFTADMVDAIKKFPTVNPWHYPSKGELPTENGEYLCCYYEYGSWFNYLYKYDSKNNYWYEETWLESKKKGVPQAWQYIIPPKEGKK